MSGCRRGSDAALYDRNAYLVVFAIAAGTCLPYMFDDFYPIRYYLYLTPWLAVSHDVHHFAAFRAFAFFFGYVVNYRFDRKPRQILLALAFSLAASVGYPLLCRFRFAAIRFVLGFVENR
jgi:hypothetical protein